MKPFAALLAAGLLATPATAIDIHFRNDNRENPIVARGIRGLAFGTPIYVHDLGAGEETLQEAKLPGKKSYATFVMSLDFSETSPLFQTQLQNAGIDPKHLKKIKCSETYFSTNIPPRIMVQIDIVDPAQGMLGGCNIYASAGTE